MKPIDIFEKKELSNILQQVLGIECLTVMGTVFQYVLAFNSDFIDQDLLPNLNVISLAVTSVLRSKRIEQKARLLEQDIDKAREIQLGILPDPFIHFYFYDIYGISVPDRIVGGDFFDYLFADEIKDRLMIVVGDAASKGFRAAAQALYVVGALRMGIAHQTKTAALMSGINKIVNRSFSEEQFVSMFYAELDRRRQRDCFSTLMPAIIVRWFITRRIKTLNY